MSPRSAANTGYAPLYFLSSVGAGGLAVTFFMYLMFWVKHPGQSVPVFEDIAAAFGSGSLPLQIAIVLGMAGVAVFGVLNLRYLAWNLGKFNAFRKTDAYETLRNSNGETTLLALPLALAMSINVGFLLGLVFVPGLWGIVEYLFPAAMAAFVLVGILAFAYIGDFLGRVLSKGGLFDVTLHNSFAQLLPAFALAMVAVGLSAPAAMSSVPATVGTALVLSTVFGTLAVLYALVAGITAFNSMLHYGTAREAAPTLLILIPLLTVLGIMVLRQDHGLHTTFEVHGTAAETMSFLAKVLAVQFGILGLGLAVLRKQGYLGSFVFGDKTSPGAYTLVCPGVALSVMLHFFINKGLVATGLIVKFGVAYWAFTSVALAFQIAMIALVFYLNSRHFGAGRTAAAAVPAE